MWKSLTALTRQAYTCIVRPNICSVSHQAVCHMSEGRKDETRIPSYGDEQHDKKNWKLHFPSKETLEMSVDGVPFNQLPIVNIRSTKNNVMMTLCKPTGEILYGSTNGALGFKTARRKTTLAAQTLGMHIGEKSRHLGLKNVRVCLKGISSKRNSALLGLQTTGVRIVSISDITKVPYNGCRPRRKPRK
ncbi:small ribosomal subunit protein uS11-like isoform X1 [Crassostrea virginica]